MKTITKKELLRVVLECGEFFRDEIQLNVISARQKEAMEQLKTKCFDALAKSKQKNQTYFSLADKYKLLDK